MDYSDDKYNVFVRQTMWWEEKEKEDFVVKTPVEFQEEKNYKVDDLVYDETQNYLWQVFNTDGYNNMVETTIEKTQDSVKVRKNKQGIFVLVEGVDSMSFDSLGVFYKRAFLQIGADEAAAEKFKEEFCKISLWQHMLNLFLNEVVPNHDFLLAKNIRSVWESAFKEDKEGWIFVKKIDSDERLKYRFLDSKVSFKSNVKTYKLTRDEFLEFLDDQEKKKYEEFPITYKNIRYTKNELKKLEKALDETEFKIIELGQDYILDDKLVKKLDKEEFETYLQESKAQYNLGKSFDTVETRLREFYDNLFSHDLYVDNKPLGTGTKHYPEQVVQQLQGRVDGVYSDIATGRQFVVRGNKVYLTYDTNGSYTSAYEFFKGPSKTKELDFNPMNPKLQQYYNDVYDEMKNMLDAMIKVESESSHEVYYQNNVDSRMLENLDDENNDFFRFGDLASKGSDGLRSMSKKASQPAQWKNNSLLFEFLRYNDPVENEDQSNFVNFKNSTKGTDSAKKRNRYLVKQKQFVKELKTILRKLDKEITDKDDRKKPHLLGYFTEENDYKPIIDNFVLTLTENKKEALFYFLNGFFTRDEGEELFTGRIEYNTEHEGVMEEDIRLSFCLFESFLFHLFSELAQTQDTYRKFLKKIVGKQVLLKRNEAESPNVLKSPPQAMETVTVKSLDDDTLILGNEQRLNINDYGTTFWGLTWSDKILKYVDDDYFLALENFMNLVVYWEYAVEVFSYLNDKLLALLGNEFKLLYASNVADTLAGVMEELLPNDQETYQTVFKNEVKTRFGRKVKLTPKADALAQDTSKLDAVSLKTRLKIAREKHETIIVPFKRRINNIDILTAARRLQRQIAYCFYQAFERTGEDPGTLELREFSHDSKQFFLFPPSFKTCYVLSSIFYNRKEGKLEEPPITGGKELHVECRREQKVEIFLIQLKEERNIIFLPDRVFLSQIKISKNYLQWILTEYKDPPKEVTLRRIDKKAQKRLKSWKKTLKDLNKKKEDAVQKAYEEAQKRLQDWKKTLEDLNKKKEDAVQKADEEAQIKLDGDITEAKRQINKATNDIQKSAIIELARGKNPKMTLFSEAKFSTETKTYVTFVGTLG